jgi:hypothetical protein
MLLRKWTGNEFPDIPSCRVGKNAKKGERWKRIGVRMANRIFNERHFLWKNIIGNVSGRRNLQLVGDLENVGTRFFFNSLIGFFTKKKGNENFVIIQDPPILELFIFLDCPFIFEILNFSRI